jgi:tetratricopeptide (TPR) repeat protein
VLTLASALFHAGEASLALDDVDGARPLLDEGAALCRRLAADHPYNENYVLRLVDNRVRLAIALDPEEAVPLFEEAAAAIGPLAARNPDRFLIRVHESQVLSNLAWALAELPDLERALPAADRAVELVERLVADFPDATDHWQSVFVHVVRGLARLRAGERPDFEEIERILAERAATRERALRGVGRLYAAWGGVLRARGATDAEVEAAATRALDLLAEAIALGFDRVHELPDDPEWAKLGEHPEFRALVGAR